MYTASSSGVKVVPNCQATCYPLLLDNSIRHLYANATEPSITHPDPKYAARLNAVPAYNKTIGPTLSLAVREGDVVHAEVQAYYEAAASTTTLPADSLLPAIAGAFAATGVVDGQVIQDAMSSASVSVGTSLQTDGGNGLPHAYLNDIYLISILCMLTQVSSG